MAGALPGAEADTKVAIRCKSWLIDEFDEWVDGSDYDSRSEAIRALMKSAVDGGPRDETPLRPPTDDALAWGYKRLVAASNGNGYIPGDMARRVCSGGPPGYSKAEASDFILRPLHRRNYLRRVANVYGDSAWRVVGAGDE